MKIDLAPLLVYIRLGDYGKFERDIIKLINKYQYRYEKERISQEKKGKVNP